jgi:phosphoribosyl 1,2-cyclic phosphodiesterase
MSLFITSINSGSNGNCYYVGNATEAILVDVGISCREVEKRMRRLQLSMDKVKAIFISHEHSDHIRGVPVIASKYNLPVYITRSTLKNCPFGLCEQLTKTFSANIPVHIGGLNITPFKKLHDAIDPHSFVIEHQNVKVGVFTDIGASCSNLVHYFNQCHAVFLESNYDEEMLANGRYPYYLKNRIRGGCGHLSNKQALECFTKYRSSHLSHLILSHLSKDNNCPKLVKRLFSENANGTEIIVASRFEETPVYSVERTRFTSSQILLPVVSNVPEQMSLF